MDNRSALAVAAAALVICIVSGAKRPDIVIGSTTFSLTNEVLRCMDLLGLGVSNSTNPGGDMRRCLRNMGTTTRAPNETYFNNLEHEILVAEEGSSALLGCEVVNLGLKHVKWMRQQEDLSQQGILYTADRRFKMNTFNSTFNIRIYPVKRSDAGIYRCQVRGKRSGNGPERIVELTVPSLPKIVSLEPTSLPYFNPSMPDRRYFNKSSDVTLFCNATGSPEPMVSWKRVQQRTELRADAFIVRRDTVLLPNITERDAGVYNCTASNGVGDVERSIEVVVQYKPIVNTPTPRIRVGLGDYVAFICYVRAVPRAEVVWKKNSIFKQSDGQGDSIDRKQFTKYIIVSANPETDYANYTCIATNMIGSSQVTVELHGRPLAPTVTSRLLSSRRRAYPLSWQPGVPPNGMRPQDIAVSSYVILFKGWWIEKRGPFQRVVYTHEKPLREVIPAVEEQQFYSYIIRDLRPNTTYELTVFGQNQYGNGDPAMFTFYTANENAPSTPVLAITDSKTTAAQRITANAWQSGATLRNGASTTWLLVICAIVTIKIAT